MDNATEKKMMDFMKPLFGDMARKTIENQKEKLKLTKGELSYDQYVLIIKSIKDLCLKMAGAAVASKMEKGLMQILDAHKT